MGRSDPTKPPQITETSSCINYNNTNTTANINSVNSSISYKKPKPKPLNVTPIGNINLESCKTVKSISGHSSHKNIKSQKNEAMIELEEYEKNKSFILQFIRDEDDNELNNVLLTEIRKPILEEPEKENESINCEQKNCINFLKKISLKWVLIVTILACLVAYILMFYELPTAKEYMIFTKWLIITGQGLVAQNRWEIWLIFALIEVVLGLFCLPGKGGINMIEAFLAQQFMKVFLIAA